MGIVSLLPIEGSIDPNLKKNIENINSFGINADNLELYINSNNTFNAEQITAIIADIDLKTTGLNDLFTIPSGKKFFLSSLIIECTGADGITTEATIDLGFNDPDYDNFTSGLLLEGLLTTTDFYKATISGTTKIMNAGDELKMNVAIASTGTSQSVKVYVSGLLRAI